jgi:hypothetical protein
MDSKTNSEAITMLGSATKTYQLSYAFKQQLMQAWRPKPTLKCAITVYTIIGLIFFAIGISILVLNDKATEQFYRYDDKCQQIGKTCEFTFEVEQDVIAAPIYFYYQIRGFYQNHRRHIQSISYEQLRDGVMKNATEVSSCEPVVYNRDNFYNMSATNKPLDPDQPAFPCGLVARSYFNDTFQLIRVANNTEVVINGTGIAWPDDINYKFKNANLDFQWIDVLNERFITWIKISPFPDFRKSWGVIREDLPKGTYKIVVKNNWNANIFQGQKWVILSQTNSFGGKNEFLAYSYLVVGAISIILAIAFVLRKIRRPKGVLDERIREFA